MSSTSSTRPNLLEYIGYCYGLTLPPAMREWVRNDLAGPGAARRMVVRAAIPCILLLAPLLLIPTTLYVYVSMTIPILIPFIYFSIALNKVWRRHRLTQHGLDPELADEIARQRDAEIHRAYEQRHGRA